MSLQVIFLGTAGSIPTAKRNLPAILIWRKGEQLIFDCGEGVQRQMTMAKGGFHKKTKIFVTHMHGDHILGLPGLLHTMSLLGRERRVDLFGPSGIGNFLECIRDTVQFVLTFPVEIHEIDKAGVICDEKEYIVRAISSNHVVAGLAYAFIEKPRPGKFHPEKAEALGIEKGPSWSRLQKGENVKLPDGRIVKSKDVMGLSRPGRKIVYTGDTRPFNDLVILAADADLLIHDCTLDDELSERADEDGHSTPSQAAEIAKRANAKQLILTHISARYYDANTLLEQAQKTFKKTMVAEDFMRTEVPLPDN
jgi:ribonuclease Z